MTALLLVLCGAASGWYARGAVVRWRYTRALNCAANNIIRRAP